MKQNFCRAAEERFYGDETMRFTDPLGPLAMLIEQDVAKHDVRDSVGVQPGECIQERRVVRRPCASTENLPQPKSICLRCKDLWPQSMRSAARGVFIEHRHHGDDVESGVDTVKGGAAVFAAAPGNGCASGHGSFGVVRAVKNSTPGDQLS